MHSKVPKTVRSTFYSPKHCFFVSSTKHRVNTFAKAVAKYFTSLSYPSRIDKNVPFCSDKVVGSRRPTDRTSASEAGNSGSNPDESARVRVPIFIKVRRL